MAAEHSNQVNSRQDGLERRTMALGFTPLADSTNGAPTNERHKGSSDAREVEWLDVLRSGREIYQG